MHERPGAQRIAVRRWRSQAAIRPLELAHLGPQGTDGRAAGRAGTAAMEAVSIALRATLDLQILLLEWLGGDPDPLEAFKIGGDHSAALVRGAEEEGGRACGGDAVSALG